MANFPQLPYPAWLKGIINPRNRASVNGSGFQGAHQIGDKYWIRTGVEFDKKFVTIEQFGIGANTSSNGEMLPQSQRGGMVLGATNHDGPHSEALNEAQYDTTKQRKTVLGSGLTDHSQRSTVSASASAEK